MKTGNVLRPQQYSLVWGLIAVLAIIVVAVLILAFFCQFLQNAPSDIRSFFGRMIKPIRDSFSQAGIS